MKKARSPKLNLIINKNLDIVSAKGFLRYEKDQWFLRRFFPKELHYILKKDITTKKKDVIIKNYTEEFYIKNVREIEKGLSVASKRWGRVEKRYFELVNEVFNGHAWPKGDYKGVLSIFNMYPRWIDKKIFFLPYECKGKNFSNSVIAHEMLHFIFFDFIKNRYNLEDHSKIKGEESDYIWKVSEVFNNVILNSRKFHDLLKDKERPYPGTEKIFKKMTAQWRAKKDIDWFLDKWLKNN